MPGMLNRKMIARVDKNLKSTLTTLTKKLNKTPWEQLDLFRDTPEAVRQQLQSSMDTLFPGAKAAVKVTQKNDTMEVDVVYQPVTPVQSFRVDLKPWIKIDTILDKDQLHKMDMGDVEERIEAALWAPAEHVLIMLNGNDWLQAVIAEWRLGGSPLPEGWTPEQLEHHLDTWR